MSDAPETIYAHASRKWYDGNDTVEWSFDSASTEYRRADLVDAEIERLRNQVRAINSSMGHHAATADSKLAAKDAEIERLRGEVEKLKERIRNANNAYAKLWDEVERLQSENEGYAKSYDALSDELAAERQRARMPDIPSEKVLSAISESLFNASFLHGSSDVPTDIYEAILSAMGLDNG